MVDENFLINDENEAIDGYKEYLSQGVRDPRIIPIINSIIRDEEKHKKLLSRIKKMRAC